MDSTLITIECIDEIADFCGLKSRSRGDHVPSMRGEIKDFNESLTRRVALLKGLDASQLERLHEERLQPSPAQLSCSRARVLQIEDPARVRRLHVLHGKVEGAARPFDFTRGNTLEIVDGKLTWRAKIVNADVKARTLRETCAQLGIATERAIAMADGSNGLEDDGGSGFVGGVSREAGRAGIGERRVQFRRARRIAAAFLPTQPDIVECRLARRRNGLY